uniref:Uncharacterized protein n=1 Tax=Anguilla anguilla TaxID=7936 RepID=A0A0E9PZ13_ANGAN
MNPPHSEQYDCVRCVFTLYSCISINIITCIINSHKDCK